MIGYNGGNYKLSEQDVRQLRADYATGRFTQKELGVKYGVSQASVHTIVTGKVHKRVRGPRTAVGKGKHHGAIVRGW